MNDKNTPTVDRLLGFDSRRLQREMTAGLADWHRRRREATLDRRFVGTALVIASLMVTVTHQVAPTLNYRLDGDTSYEQTVEMNNAILGR